MPNSLSRSVAIVGATGLIGGMLLQRLIEWQQVTGGQLIVCARRKPEGLSDTIVFIDLTNTNWQEKLAQYSITHAFNCLGTTIKVAKTREAFRAVDHDLVMDFARTVQQAGAGFFSTVSSLGASESSPAFYSRVKGEVERELKQMNFDHLAIWQPSLLVGDRKEERFGEDLGQVAFKLLNLLLLGPLEKYQSIQAEWVAKAMLAESQLTQLTESDKELSKGVCVYHKPQIKQFSNSIK